LIRAGTTQVRADPVEGITYILCTSETIITFLVPFTASWLRIGRIQTLSRIGLTIIVSAGVFIPTIFGLRWITSAIHTALRHHTWIISLAFGNFPEGCSIGKTGL
jgi:hypothetical protein